MNIPLRFNYARHPFTHGDDDDFTPTHIERKLSSSLDTMLGKKISDYRDRTFTTHRPEQNQQLSSTSPEALSSNARSCCTVLRRSSATCLKLAQRQRLEADRRVLETIGRVTEESALKLEIWLYETNLEKSNRSTYGDSSTAALALRILTRLESNTETVERLCETSNVRQLAKAAFPEDIDEEIFLIDEELSEGEQVEPVQFYLDAISHQLQSLACLADTLHQLSDQDNPELKDQAALVKKLARYFGDEEQDRSLNLTPHLDGPEALGEAKIKAKAARSRLEIPTPSEYSTSPTSPHTFLSPDSAAFPRNRGRSFDTPRSSAPELRLFDEEELGRPPLRNEKKGSKEQGSRPLQAPGMSSTRLLDDRASMTGMQEGFPFLRKQDPKGDPERRGRLFERRENYNM